MKIQLLAAIVVLLPLLLDGQGSPLQLDNDAYHIMDRLQIQTGRRAPFHSAVKPFTRGAVTAYALSIDTARVPISSMDRKDLYYIFRDNNEWLAGRPDMLTLGERRMQSLTQIQASMENARYTESKKPFLKYFYPTPANFIEVNQPQFYLRANPVVRFQLAGAKDDDQPIFENLRGVSVRGGVDDRVYFTFTIHETQARFLGYVEERIARDGVIPGAGFKKIYRSNLFNIENGFDYLNGDGSIGFNFTRHIGLQFGYGRQFLGDGYRSLLLSDFANNYLYLRLNWDLGRFHYQNLYAELARDPRPAVSGEPIVKKYMAAHHLSIDLTDNLNFGIFETVVFSRNNQFEFHYLLPIILYRTVEQSLGSPDNVMIGFDGHWNFLRRFQLYGQLLFDEFKFNELFIEKRGWWANKVGGQAGLKYIDAFGLDHLDLQAEVNIVRPYTYSHDDKSASYVHYNQPLAHPLGATFKESVLIARYKPVKRVQLQARLIMASFGEDADTTNYGSNPILPNKLRESDYGNEIGQGIHANTVLFGFDAAYQVAHNLFFDLEFFTRKKDSEEDIRDTLDRYFGAGIRLNIGRRRMDF